MAKIAWRSFPCCLSELRLEHTLKCGQSFRWREVIPGVWTGVIGHQVWRLRQDHSHLYYQVFHKEGTPVNFKSHLQAKTSTEKCDIPVKTEQVVIKEEPFDKSDNKEELANNGKIQDLHSTNLSKLTTDVKKEPISDSDTDNENILTDYFQLNVNLGKLYKSWSDADSNFKKISSNFEGIRMLRQDPVENLFSFICSSNNHISRISSMVEKLCDNYGDEIAHVDGKMYHAFPDISSLASDDVEAKLRELGFGYRAKYINKTARYITDNHNEDWLYSLRSIPYKDTKKELMTLCGVGAKVADCVCLMSMDKPGSIPVDTHVWQIATRHYLTKLQHSKSLTDKLYEEIGDYFRSLWGEYAGWAHSVLFAADLKHFKDNHKDNKQDTRDTKKKSTQAAKRTAAVKKTKDEDKVKKTKTR